MWISKYTLDHFIRITCPPEGIRINWLCKHLDYNALLMCSLHFLFWSFCCHFIIIIWTCPANDKSLKNDTKRVLAFIVYCSRFSYKHAQDNPYWNCYWKWKERKNELLTWTWNNIQRAKMEHQERYVVANNRFFSSVNDTTFWNGTVQQEQSIWSSSSSAACDILTARFFLCSFFTSIIDIHVQAFTFFCLNEISKNAENVRPPESPSASSSTSSCSSSAQCTKSKSSVTCPALSWWVLNIFSVSR